MWRTNLKILGTVVATLGMYTLVANVIPQVQSEVPQRREISSDVSPEELVGIGEEIYHGAGGCEACHGLGTRAPDLLGVIGGRCAERVSGQDCKSYLHESLVEPQAHLVEGFQPIMPDMDTQLSPTQIWAVVAFLQSQGGDVTVTSGDLAAAGEDGAGGAAAGGGGAAAGAAGGAGAAAAGAGGASATASATEPGEIFRAYGCLACHVFQGEGAQVGPPIAETRAADLDPEYVRRAILSPNADTAEGYEAMAGTMPPNFGQRMTAAQLQTLVEYLSGGGS